MSIEITTNVFCNLCPNWIFGATGSGVDTHGARLNAKRDGWTREQHDGKLVDVCPHCKAMEVSITTSPL